MTERVSSQNGVTRREALRGGLFGLATGLGIGGTAERHNVLGIDRDFESLQRGFEHFMETVCALTNLDSYYPGGIRRLASDERELRRMFSQKSTEPTLDNTGTHYQLLLPSDTLPFDRLAAAITMSVNRISSVKPEVPRLDLLNIEAFFTADDTDAQSCRLFNFDNFTYPHADLLRPSVLVGIASQMTADHRFMPDDEWLIYNDGSEVVSGEVFIAERAIHEGPRTIEASLETSGYYKYAETYTY